MSKKVGIIRGDIFLEHDTGPGHPESPERLVSIYGMLDQSGLSAELKKVELRKAAKEEILLIHSEDHYDRIQSTQGRETYLDGDTPASPKSFEAALYAAGSLLEMVDQVMGGKLDSGFALIRPPGHHAERDEAKGFCLFNNIGIAAAYALANQGLKRILVADFDVHHGNGTQHSFYDTDQVLYFSTHRYPFYPGTGYFNEIGTGKGKGFTINIPLPSGMGDAEYDTIYTNALMPIAREYQPELILVSAGFDCYDQDPLGGMEVTEAGFARLGSIFLKLADELCPGKLIFGLEGGYSLEGIARCIREVLVRMLGREKPVEEMGKPTEGFERLLQELSKHHKLFWKGLSL